MTYPKDAQEYTLLTTKNNNKIKIHNISFVNKRKSNQSLCRSSNYKSTIYAKNQTL